MSQKISKRIRAYELFAQGYEPKSPEVKALKLTYGSASTYYSSWKKEGSPSPPPPEAKVEAKPKAEPKIVKGATRLPGGESIRPLTEVELIPLKVESEESEIESDESKPKSEEEKPSGEKIAVPSDGKKQQAKSILAEGLTITISISTKTLMFYQLACSRVGNDLAFGDFIDSCVEDSHRVRGFDLGLIPIGGKR